jgi:hypothetical protein
LERRKNPVRYFHTGFFNIIKKYKNLSLLKILKKKIFMQMEKLQGILPLTTFWNKAKGIF